MAEVVCCVSYPRRKNAHEEAAARSYVADLAPADPAVTTYDEEHIVTYLRLLDADAEGADWRDVSRIVLRIDPDNEADCARVAFESHLSRARWITEQGYRHLLRSGARSSRHLPLLITLDHHRRHIARVAKRCRAARSRIGAPRAARSAVAHGVIRARMACRLRDTGLDLPLD